MQSYEAVQIPPHNWQRASRCQLNECVEIAAHDGKVVMRSSIRPDSSYLYFTPEEFDAFLVDAKAGKFNLA